MVPKNEAELAELISAARGPLGVRGGGTRLALSDGEMLTTSGLNGITLYEPGALTMVAKAGTRLDKIEATLAQEGQRLAFEPYLLSAVTGAAGASTIGGVFATNASGSRRVQAGAARDFLLGVRFVDGAGRIVKNGGRVMKNVTGYDLVKLMAGSYGSLGVLSEVSFKVLPAPETSLSVVLHELTDHEAVRAMSKALGSPYDVSGAMHIPGDLDGSARTVIRVEGFEASARYRANELVRLLDGFGERDISDTPEAWGAARDLSVISTTSNGETGALWQLSSKPSDAPAVMQRISERFEVLYFFDWGGGRVWVWASTNLDTLHTALQAEMSRVGGHATLMHSDKALDVSRFQPQLPQLQKIAEGLRQKFDPRGILNPGLMG